MKSKEVRQREARERQERYDLLTPLEKIQQIKKRPGSSLKELQKIANEVLKNGGDDHGTTSAV
jgi:hypothetical protein